MYESKWYEFKIINDKVNIFYRKGNRLRSFLTFVLLISIYLNYRFILSSYINLVLEIIFIIIMVFFFLMFILVDENMFNNKEKKLYIKRGFYPFIKVKIIPYSEIEGLEIIEHEIGYRKKKMYEFILFLKKGNKIKFGLFKKETKIKEIRNLISLED